MSDIPLLEVNEVTKEFLTGGILKKRYIKAVEDVSFTLNQDEATITTICGESGSGKTTIANLILALLTPTSGDIQYKGKNIHKMSKNALKTYRKEVQAVFQDPYAVYNPFYRIDRVISLPLKRFNLASSKADADNIMRDSMKDVGLRPNELLGRYPHQLSGGERQRFMLARILAIMPKIIVADEPISMIDVSLRSMFLNKLLDFKTQHGISSIFITHDLTSAYYLGGNVMILCRGRILEKGDMESVVKNPAHPYTKMLIDSIPASNPKNRWTDKIELKVSKLTADSKSASTGCVFYYGCEHCIERCLTEKPPMYETSSNHLVACFLHA